MDNYHSNKAIKFLRWFCRPEFLDEIEGDIIELFELRIEEDHRKANRMLWWDVLRSFRWINLKKVNTQNNTVSMFNNYFKVSFRNLIRDFRYTLINIFGLTLGLTIFLIMMIMVRHEFSFDKFHSKSERTYQIIQEFRQTQGADPEIWTPVPLAEALAQEVSAVEESIHLQGTASNWVEVADQRFFEEDGMIVGANFFDIFDFQLKSGNPETALSQPRSTVISEQLSKKYFGFNNPIGQTITHEFYGPFTITGVLENVPENSYLQFDFVITEDLDTYLENVVAWYPDWYRSWQGHAVSTFVVLNDEANVKSVTDQIQTIVANNLETEDVNRFYLLNMLDLHFGSNGIDGRINQHFKGDIGRVRLFMIVAGIILLMACFNYVNIATARSAKRHKEVGIRKSIGAFRSQLIVQFLVESFLLVSISVLIAVALSYFLIPLFGEIMDIKMNLDQSVIIDMLPGLVILVLGGSLMAGIYPALILSGISPLALFRKMNGTSWNLSLLKNGLVTLQFCAVIVLSACLIIINQQYNYMSQKSLGFDTDELVVVEINSGNVRRNYTTIKNELKKHPTIKDVTGITRVFSGYRSAVSILANKPEAPTDQKSMKFYGLDHEAIDVFDLEILVGEGFQGIDGVDSTTILLNESAANLLGGADVVGSWIELDEDQGDHNGRLQAKVAGIVKDFHFESLHQPIKPTVLGYYKSPFESIDDIIIKVDGNQVQEALEAIEKVHNVYDTNDILDWEFLDDMTQRAYEDEMIFRDILSAASLVSVLIAILGMIGMISYNIISRTKEFGIRKVLGATFGQLLFVQGRVFIKYLLLASVLSLPVAWWIARNWLATYAFRITLTPLPFALIITGLLLITGVTIYYLGRSTFRQNPTKALRYE